MTPIRLHRHALSGHSHRAELMASLLGLPVELVDVDLAGGDQRTPAFLALNPFAQVPVIEDGDRVVSDSNAILVYLALRYDPARRWYPADPGTAAAIQRWLSVAAGPLAAGAAVARAAHVFRRAADTGRARGIAEALFAVLDRHLAGQPFLTGNAATIADVALYTYTAHAPEGGIALDPHPAIVAWLARIEALDGFVPMARSALPESVA